MCGIVGVLNWGKMGILPAHMGIFMQMLHADAVRGMHGTGAFAVADDSSNYRVRAGGPPHTLVDSKEFEHFEKFIEKKFVQFVVGHNRYGTRGGFSTEATHPFRDGEVLLVHNGTLESHGHLPDAKKYDVDSEAICHAFSVQGAEKTVPTLSGAWTFVWWDGNNKTLNFLRNKERPLWIAKHQTDPILYFASEPAMLQWVLTRNNITLFDLIELPENQMYSYSLNSSKPHVKELKGKATFVFADSWWNGWGDKSRAEAVGSGKAQSRPEEDRKIVPLPKKQTYSNVSGSTSSSGTTGYAGSSNRGSLPQKASSGTSGGFASEKGYWTSVDSLHDLYKGQKIVITPLMSKPLTTENSSAELFQIKGLADNYPDIEFLCNVRGKLALETIMDAPEGMRAEIKSVLRSMNKVAKFPHQIYLHNPEPMYFVEPPIPAHAEVKEKKAS